MIPPQTCAGVLTDNRTGVGRGVFSILEDTFDNDQRSARADYMELSLQLQFNDRSRKKELEITGRV